MLLHVLGIGKGVGANGDDIKSSYSRHPASTLSGSGLRTHISGVSSGVRGRIVNSNSNRDGSDQMDYILELF
ncbi:uncharacterized protein OCT59_028896 [Rhizophagus irregularis]|uniref:uncharacterized protein n=1 Tax=Rhizophagus irregularis TaxID=588596 RepID=UPI0033298950|nr:hypothetical protein OCT59_028896 [Rhizophagus irregularis]